MQENTLFSLKGKTILVTGASAGLGKQIAIDCSKMGANLVITGRNSERLKETLDMLSFGRHICRTVNLTDEVERSFFVEAMPSLDGIVHCAGINKVMPCSFIKESNYSDILKINLEAPIFLQKSILKAKKLNNNASVVFISSIASKYSSIGNSVYSASKAGLNSYAKILAKEIANKKIRVNCVLPGMIKTGLNQTFIFHTRILHPFSF